MSSHPPGTDNDEILVEDELESIAGGSEMSPLHTKSSAAPFLSSRASSGEPVGTETDEEDDHESRSGQRSQTNYGKVRRLDPEGAEKFPTTSPRKTIAVYHFKRYIPRAVLNVLGPLFILSLYIFIVVQYFQRPAVNGIIPPRPLDANTIFFAWLILSIFLLDWAKSGIAGFEAAALMKPRLAPKDARQLMWHTDRAWGSVSGWCEVLIVGVEYLCKRLTRRRAPEWSGPGPLWFYLAFSSMLFYITVPLSGLSINPENALVLSDRPIAISGTNQTTFDGRPSNDLAEQVDGRWRQGNPTTPYGPTIFYAPKGTPDVSDTYLEDTVQSIYQKQLANDSFSADDSKVTFFAGPEVTERAHGTAWGFLTDLSCMPVNPYTDLELLQVQAINNWTANPASTSSLSYGVNISQFESARMLQGTEAVFFDIGGVEGLRYQYLAATNSDVTGGILSPYAAEANLPLNGTFELVMWQSYTAPVVFEPDEMFRNMSGNPVVVSSVSIYDGQTYLGYGVRCKAVTNTGRADLSATTNTFSSFRQEAPAPNGHASASVALSTGVVGLHTLVYTALTSQPLLVQGPAKCKADFSATCSGWIGANKATKAVPNFKFLKRASKYPTLGPARMTLAISKLFGEAAVAVMSGGPGNWTSTPNATSNLGLFGLEPVNDIVPGRVPYGVVIALLTLWALMTIVPQLQPTFLYGRRWGDVLDGFAMFRLGAEWKDAVDGLESDRFWSSGAASLRVVPGMVGDMNPPDGGGKLQGAVDGRRRGNVGYVGLSHYKAETSNRRLYSYRSL